MIFIGDLARSFKAVDVGSGEVLWETKLGTSVQGLPISFSVDGKQYVAVPTGYGAGGAAVLHRVDHRRGAEPLEQRQRAVRVRAAGEARR